MSTKAELESSGETGLRGGWMDGGRANWEEEREKFTGNATTMNEGWNGGGTAKVQ